MDKNTINSGEGIVVDLRFVKSHGGVEITMWNSNNGIELASQQIYGYDVESALPNFLLLSRSHKLKEVYR